MLSFAAIKLLRVKEAYRVLAGKDPSRIAPHKIEEFLGQADLLRKKSFGSIYALPDRMAQPIPRTTTLSISTRTKA